jgi:type VI protein secretion system component Hcp
MDRPRASWKSLLLIAVAVLVGAGTVAVASIPGSDGVITACWNSTAGSTYGALRVIDPSLAGTTRSANEYSCQSGETQITWNQQGPTGPTGPTGPAGPAGPQGARAPSSVLSFSGSGGGGGGGGSLYLLKLKGLTGESQVKKHKGEIDLKSVSFGAGQNKPKSAEIIVVKRIDSTSPKLFVAAASGKSYPKGSIEFIKRKTGQEYLVFKMKDVLVTSVKTLTGGGDPLPSEQVTLTFTSLSEEFLGNRHTTIHLTPHQFSLP